MAEFSKLQKQQLRALYEKSYNNECTANMSKLIEVAESWKEGKTKVEDAWESVDKFVFKKSKEMYSRYDGYRFRYSQILMILGVQYALGYLTNSDFEGLDSDLQDKLKRLVGVTIEAPKALEK